MSDAAATSAPANGKAKVNKKELKAAQKAAKGGGGGDASAPRAVDAPLPEWLVERARKWDEIVAKRAAEAKQSSPSPIKVTLPNGKVMDATSESTPLDICRQISNSLEKKVVAGKVTFEGAEPAMWDLGRPLGKDCKLELLEFDSPDGKKVFWHSSAHVLGQAIEREFHEAKLCIGPAVEEGFYYDVYLGSERKVRPDDYANLESFIDKITKEKQPFTRLELKKEEAIEMFKDNQFKQEILKNKVPDGATCTAYRCGPLIDLCKGPHVPNTGVIKALSVIKHSASYWLAKSDRESLQRIYGISFPDKAALKEYKEMLKKAEERDHRKIGLEQKLFFFHELSPGSCFFMPHGARLYNTLINFIKSEYVKRGYREVVTPNIYNVDLWKTSGHWQHYAENMYSFKIEDAEFALKPMNCPGHCLMFRQNLRSYRELPLRLADFGVLHRNEISGALSGLTRVRRFQQDDAHIFCTHAQIEEEVRGVLDFMQYVYRIFGFKFTLMLSTRPEKYLGEIEVWNKAEKALENSLTQVFGKEWSVNPGDGAFYGPKIDIQLTDALNRKHQCATIQLDFQLPIRFGLEYNAGGDIHEHEHHQHEQHDEKDKEAVKAAKKEHAKAKKEAAKANKGDWDNKDGAKPAEKKEGELTDGFERPVMIHRAILGSVERMIAVLTEHTGGKWPFWLSPRQAIVVPIGEKYFDYATQVRDVLVSAGFHAEADISNSQFKKKVRDGQIEQYNFILVVGEKEQANKTVNVRQRDKEGHAEEAIPLSQLLEMFQQLKNNHQ